MKPLLSHIEQKTPKIQPFLRFHYLLKFLILMSFRWASPPCAPHRALPYTGWGTWRSPYPSLVKGAATNVNSWIRAWHLCAKCMWYTNVEAKKSYGSVTNQMGSHNSIEIVKDPRRFIFRRDADQICSGCRWFKFSLNRMTPVLVFCWHSYNWKRVAIWKSR